MDFLELVSEISNENGFVPPMIEYENTGKDFGECVAETVQNDSVDGVKTVTTSNKKARAAVAVGASMTAGAMFDAALAGASIGGPFGMIMGMAVSYCAASAAKTVYDAC